MPVVRDPPDTSFLRVGDVERAVRTFSNPTRAIRRARSPARRIESRESLGEHLRRTCLAVLVEGHEHHVIAALVARAVQYDERAVSVRRGERAARVKEKIERRRSTRLEG